MKTKNESNVIFMFQRKIERKEVCFEAEVRQGDLLVKGTVRDYSLYGLFFEPEIATDGNEFFQGEDILDQLDSDGGLQVSCKGILYSSKIKWQRKSTQHGCFGFGCEFEKYEEKVA